MWRLINSFYLTKDWQYSNPIQGEIFRVKSYYIDNFNNQYLKGVVASIFVDDQQVINLVESRRLSYRLEPEIFTFYFPPGLGNQRIGVKRLDSTDLTWSVEIEVFQSVNSTQDFENYLISRFGEIAVMALYQRGNAVTPLLNNSNNTDFNAQEQKRVLEANSARRSLTITNGSSTILIFGGVDKDGKITNVIRTLLANEEYEFPTLANGSIYMGEVWIRNLSQSSARVGHIEFNAPQ